MKNLFNGIYQNKTVLITGHTGFKGSWLSLWLKEMGANVVGYSLSIPTTPSHFQILNLDITSIFADIRNQEKLNEVFEKYRPDIVFHLAAQPLVRYSYENPVETYDTNVMGTLKVFEACRLFDINAIVNITSDKAYENKEYVWGYRENDTIGGYDPYSSSKGCSELLTTSYRNSFFNPKSYGESHNTLLASCRAGNVIGGGDWAQDRLISDLVKSVSLEKYTKIRFPKAIRPWQHVLEPLSGYLLVGQKLLEKNTHYASAWNFGPSLKEALSVEEILKEANSHWKKIKYIIEENENNFHEASFLKLDCSKAYHELKWNNVWTDKVAIEKTITWYKNYYDSALSLTHKNLMSYIDDARKRSIIWT